MNLNKAIVAGNTTGQPELKTFENGGQVTNFSVASNRFYQDQQGNRQQSTEFHRIVVFGKNAGNCANYLAKGQEVLVEGRLQTRSWQTDDGVKKYVTEIIAENVQFGSKKDGRDKGEQTAEEEYEDVTWPDTPTEAEDVAF